jgi:hypothetical protein
MRRIGTPRAPRLVRAVSVAALALSGCASSAGGEWTEDFGLAERTLSDTGESRYFVLRPGFRAVLAAGDTRLTITVLDETRQVDGVVTRVVEEREEKGGQPAEVARNFFAIDQQNGDVFYFGEEVDEYAGGSVLGHSGTWLAGGGNRPGLIMPGTPRVGMKYFQELAPGVALDRAEVVSISERCDTPAGQFDSCLVTRETSALDRTVVERKAYAPAIGLVQDQALRLIEYGYLP